MTITEKCSCGAASRVSYEEAKRVMEEHERMCSGITAAEVEQEVRPYSDEEIDWEWGKR